MASGTLGGSVTPLLVADSTPLGKRSKKLAKSVTKELDQIAKLIVGAKTITCAAYSDVLV